MLETINKELEIYKWAVKESDSVLVLCNSLGKETCKISMHSKGSKYRIHDMAGNLLLTGNESYPLRGILRVMKDYFYAKPKG